MKNFNIVPVDIFNLNKYLELFRVTFEKNSYFNLDYLRWLYYKNPEGDVLGFDAFHGDELAAHYACIPVKYELEGIQFPLLLSLNTVTNPKYQGNGLFTKLANMTYERALELNYCGVIGVANQNSTHGFIKKLGFNLITPLNVYINPCLFNFSDIKENYFSRSWTLDSLNWRCQNPNNLISRKILYNKIICTSNVFKNIVEVCASIDIPTKFNVEEIPSSDRRLNLLYLYIGYNEELRKNNKFMFEMPNFLKPSPLNLIFKNLNSDIKLNKGNLNFNFLDFDAF